MESGPGMFEFEHNWDNNWTPSIEDWFHIGLAREIKSPLPMGQGIHLDLGAGNRRIGDSVPIDLEHGFDLNVDRLPYSGETVAGIWANQFFEHLEEPIRCLRECERVLEVGGVINIVVPHAMSEMYQEEITHKSKFAEGIWKKMLEEDAHWEREGEWRLQVHTCFIMGILWRNLCMFTQLVKI